MGMAMFYVLFLLTVMKFFEASEPRMASTKPVESIVVMDHDILADIKPVAERQMSSHVVRVSHPSDTSPFPEKEELDGGLDYWTLLRREFIADDSKIDEIFGGGGGSDGPTELVRPRLRSVLKRNSLRSLLGWTIGLKTQHRQRRIRRESATLHIVSSEWVTSRVR